MYGRTTHRTWPSDPVRTVMMWPVATVEAGATLTQVAEALAADEIGALCVVEHDALAGIVSERDVVAHVAAGADPGLSFTKQQLDDLITGFTIIRDQAPRRRERLGERRHPTARGRRRVAVATCRGSDSLGRLPVRVERGTHDGRRRERCGFDSRRLHRSDAG